MGKKEALVISGVEVPPQVHDAMLTVRHWLGQVLKRNKSERIDALICSSGRIEIKGQDKDKASGETDKLQALGEDLNAKNNARLKTEHDASVAQAALKDLPKDSSKKFIEAATKLFKDAEKNANQAGREFEEAVKAYEAAGGVIDEVTL